MDTGLTAFARRSSGLYSYNPRTTDKLFALLLIVRRVYVECSIFEIRRQSLGARDPYCRDTTRWKQHCTRYTTYRSG